jgi:hypothetical protein
LYCTIQVPRRFERIWAAWVVYESSTLHTTPSAHLQCARQVGRALEFIRQDGPAEEASSGLACIRSCSCGARIGTSSTSSTSYQRARALAQCVEAAAGRGADLHRTGGAVLNHGRTNRAPDRERLSRCRTTSTQTNGCRSLPDSRTSTSPPSAEERSAAQDWLHVCACGTDDLSMCSYFRCVSSSTFVQVQSLFALCTVPLPQTRRPGFMTFMTPEKDKAECPREFAG